MPSLGAYPSAPAGNLTTRTDANGHVTTYTYDAANRLTSVAGPAGRWDYQMDANGNRTRAVTPAGTSTPGIATDGLIDVAYDELNRPVSRTYSDGTPAVTYGYDADGNRTQMTDALGTETRTYDDLGRITKVSRGSVDLHAYGYDKASNILTRTTRGIATTLTYDDDGRLSRATGGGASLQYGYDADGGIVSRSDINGLAPSESRTYDRAGRLDSVSASKAGLALAATTLTLDPVGNPTRSVDHLGQVATFTYDAMNRITEVCYASTCQLPVDPFIRWTFDGVGNRLTEQRPTGTIAYAYDAGDRLLSAAGLTGTTTYAYDANGNRTSAGPWTYGYDVANRLTSASNGDASASYGYDGDGMRASATLTDDEGTSTLRTLWDPNHAVPQIAEERDGSDTLLRRYIYGSDRTAIVDPQGSHFYLHDPLGSVVGVTSAAGSVEAQYAYEPFGAPRTSLGAPTGLTNPMQFVGERLDEATGTYHLRARQYDAANGTFLQPDPVRPAIDDPYVASYVYVGNRPTVLVDPLGLFGWGSFFRTVGLIASGVALAAVLPAALGSTAAFGVFAVASAVSIGADIGGAFVACTGGASAECMSAVGWIGFDVVTVGVGRRLSDTAKVIFGGATAGVGVLRK